MSLAALFGAIDGYLEEQPGLSTTISPSVEKNSRCAIEGITGLLLTRFLGPVSVLILRETWMNSYFVSDSENRGESWIGLSLIMEILEQFYSNVVDRTQDKKKVFQDGLPLDCSSDTSLFEVTDNWPFP